MNWAAASLTETADAIRSGRVTARAVLEEVLERIAARDPHLACFVALDAAGARRAADAADAGRAAGQPLGPLHGVPMAHKDMVYRAGRVSGCGSRLRDGMARMETATVLDRLDAAGAIEIGQLAMVEFAMGPHGYNANYPQCRNAWNHDHIPCGSSSGSGVAVGARLVHAALGSDTGGSIRCPAAVNGVVGLLPTYGRVSRHGVMPMSFSLDVVGPLARTVRDAARMLDVIAGPDPLDATSLDLPAGGFEAALDAPAPPPRIGLARGYFDEGLHPEVAWGLDAAAEEFRRAGLAVEEVRLPADLLHEVAELHPLVMKAEGAANHLAQMRAAEARYTQEVGHRLHAGFFIPAVDYIQALKLRADYLRQMLAAMAGVDLLLAPVLAIPVPTIAETTGKRGRDYLDMVVALTRNTKVVNYLGLPALSLPAGFDARGLPLAVQLIGRPGGEAVLLRAGEAYQRRTDWHRRLPPGG
ncbi:amidase [Paracraurococcus ruber]|nr:amidase [Paracraurococcus ruber]